MVKFLKTVKKIVDKIPKIVLILLVILFLLVATGYLVVTLNLPVSETVENISQDVTSKLYYLLYKDQIGPIPNPLSNTAEILLPTQIPVITPTPTLSSRQILEQMSRRHGKCLYVPVLMYHHLLPAEEAKAKGAQNLNVTPRVFEEQINYLFKKGYQTIFLEELVDGLKGNRQLPAKPVVITFDDGYRDLYHALFPLVKMRNFKATIFAISQFLDGENYLTWSQLNEMAGSSLLEIGGHTLSHRALSENLGEEFIRNEVISAQRIIAERTGRTVKVFAYPYGTYNQTAEKILQEGGFTAAVKSSGGGSPVCSGLPYEIPRIRIGNAVLSQYGL